jgi:hypothetical protein
VEHSLETEIWKPVYGYEGLYEISNKGRVKSLAKEVRHPSGALIRIQPERIMKIMKNAKGYEFVDLCKDGNRFHGTVHRMVLSAFCPVENMDSLTVNHKDFDKSNNTPENLEWTTNYENVQHSKSSGRYDIEERPDILSPYQNPRKRRKFTPETIEKIHELLSSGNYNDRQISEIVGTSRRFVTAVKLGETWKQQYMI